MALSVADRKVLIERFKNGLRLDFYLNAVLKSFTSSRSSTHLRGVGPWMFHPDSI